MNFIIKWFSRKEKFFASGQKPFANGLQVKKTHCKWLANNSHRDGKNIQACEQCLCKFFIVWVKSVTNSTLFCCENELFCDFALFGVKVMVGLFASDQI